MLNLTCPTRQCSDFCSRNVCKLVHILDNALLAIFNVINQLVKYGDVY